MPRHCSFSLELHLIRHLLLPSIAATSAASSVSLHLPRLKPFKPHKQPHANTPTSRPIPTRKRGKLFSSPFNYRLTFPSRSILPVSPAHLVSFCSLRHDSFHDKSTALLACSACPTSRGTTRKLLVPTKPVSCESRKCDRKPGHSALPSLPEQRQIQPTSRQVEF
ncbi:hypothetical protein NL676_032942 [Syzygium grande]|nr:hypothetical protein NL676_032942 [Syzygium grande]